MEEGGGCIAVFLLVSVGFVLLVYGIKELVLFVSPYWPLLLLGLIVALALWALWLARHHLWELSELWRQRRRTVRQVEQARAEIRQIHAETARRMERARRQAGP